MIEHVQKFPPVLFGFIVFFYKEVNAVSINVIKFLEATQNPKILTTNSKINAYKDNEINGIFWIIFEHGMV